MRKTIKNIKIVLCVMMLITMLLSVSKINTYSVKASEQEVYFNPNYPDLIYFRKLQVGDNICQDIYCSNYTWNDGTTGSYSVSANGTDNYFTMIISSNGTVRLYHSGAVYSGANLVSGFSFNLKSASNKPTDDTYIPLDSHITGITSDAECLNHLYVRRTYEYDDESESETESESEESILQSQSESETVSVESESLSEVVAETVSDDEDNSFKILFAVIFGLFLICVVGYAVTRRR